MNEIKSTDVGVEKFSLRGVHGYKDLEIECRGAATIIAAENGTGKTTLLNAMNAFLSRRFHRLAALSFSSLECKFVGIPEPVVIHRSELGSSPVSNENIDLLSKIAEKTSISEDELLDFILSQYSPRRFEELFNHDIVRQLYINTAGPQAETRRLLDQLHSGFQPFLTDHAKEVSSLVRQIMKDISVVYLPTYRRIERPLLRTARRREATRSIYSPRSKAQQKEHSYQGIAFGLGDIEARLAELSEEIERTSNFGYRSLSARILNDMLKGKHSRLKLESGDLPDIGTLSLFLSRLGNPEFDPAGLNNLKGLFADIGTLYQDQRIYSEEYDFLRYFLSQLNTVILKTKSLEQRIEHFVQVCNSYLMMSSDEKKLEFDPSALKVVVRNSWVDDSADLDTLSSGEKQIVSLMAKLYLYEGKKLVLIDEPELSLSIDWQRKVVPDIIRSGSVSQLFAITHSPFIFENEFDEYAVPLIISKSKVQKN